MNKGSFKAMCRESPAGTEVPCYFVAEAPGLAIHRHVQNAKPDEPLELGTAWTVSHMKSGLRVAGPFGTRRAALDMAAELGPAALRTCGIRWTWSARSLLRHRQKLAALVRSMAAKHGAPR